MVWVISETGNKGEIASWDWIDNWKEENGVSLPVYRDFKFGQVYGSVNPHGNALPHIYVLDGQTMEQLYACGGAKDPQAEAIVWEKLGVDPPN